MMVGLFGSALLVIIIRSQQQLGKVSKNSIKTKNWNELITFK